MFALCSTKQLQETKNVAIATDVIEGRMHKSNSTIVDYYNSNDERFHDCMWKAIFDKDLRGA